MQVKTLMETPDGAVEFVANLSNEETKFVLEYGLNMLMQKGAVPFSVIDKDDIACMSSQESEEVH